MEIRLIFASLRKHRIPALLIVLEIALACAVLCNAVFMIGQRIGEISLPNAIDEHQLSDISVQGADPSLAADNVSRDLAALREIPGVIAATAINTVPLSNNGWNSNLSTGPGKLLQNGSPNVATYMFTQGGEKALGMRLLEGRFFTGAEYADSTLSDNYLPSAHEVILTRNLAERMWPGQDALGKQAWVSDTYHFLVVGVVADVLRPNDNGTGDAGFHWAAFLPISPGVGLGDYVLRSAPADRDRVIAEATRKLSALSPNAVIKGQTFDAIRDKYFADTRSMAWMLALVCVVMLAVTAFGIVGLTSFWVGQRRRQIGIRRAVGATRGDILRCFQTENFLLTGVGVAIGMVLAFGVSLYLMRHYAMSLMPWYYLPVGAAALWLLGQFAVLGPALRASRVPPVVATRAG